MHRKFANFEFCGLDNESCSDNICRKYSDLMIGKQEKCKFPETHLRIRRTSNYFYVCIMKLYRGSVFHSFRKTHHPNIVHFTASGEEIQLVQTDSDELRRHLAVSLTASCSLESSE